MHVPPGYALFIPSALRKAVDLPVVGVGRFKDPLQAERALAEGHCDLVGVVRGQIADPEFAAKARAGAAEEIRLCLSCNQECVGRMGLNRWLGCIENPRTGREARPPRHPATDRPPTSWWSGPGPPGCRPPSPPARAGHQVTVFERDPRPAARCAWPPRCPTGPSSATWCATSSPSAAPRRRAALRGRRRRRRGAGGLDPTRRRDRGHRGLPAPAVVGAGCWPRATCRSSTCATCSPGRSRRPVRCHRVIDELGFHQATSVAELLADRGCAVEVITNGHGGRPGPRHHARHGELVDARR